MPSLLEVYYKCTKIIWGTCVLVSIPRDCTVWKLLSWFKTVKRVHLINPSHEHLDNYIDVLNKDGKAKEESIQNGESESSQACIRQQLFRYDTEAQVTI